MFALAAAVLSSSPFFSPPDAPASAFVRPDPSAPGFDLSPDAAPSVADDPKLDVWTGAVNVALSSASGNTDKHTAAASAKAERRTVKDRWSFDFLWNYTDEDGDV